MDTNVLYIEHYIDLHTYISDKIYELDEEVVYTEGMKEWFGKVGEKVKKVGESIKNFGILLLKQLQKIWHFLTKWFTIGKCKKLQNQIKEYLINLYKDTKSYIQPREISLHNPEIKKAIEQITTKKEYESLELTDKDINYISLIINNYCKELSKKTKSDEIKNEFSLFLNTDPIELEKIINKINDIYKYIILVAFQNNKELYQAINKNTLSIVCKKTKIVLSEDLMNSYQKLSSKSLIDRNKAQSSLKSDIKYTKDDDKLKDTEKITKRPLSDDEISKVKEFQNLTNKIISIFENNKLPNKNTLKEINNILNSKKIEKLDEINDEDLDKLFRQLSTSYEIDARLITLFKNIKMLLKFMLNYPKALQLMFDICKTKEVTNEIKASIWFDEDELSSRAEGPSKITTDPSNSAQTVMLLDGLVEQNK